MLKGSINVGNRGAFNPFSTEGTPIPAVYQELIHEAVVVDVIVNDEHPEYLKDGYNVGTIKFRSLKSDVFKQTSDLHWAFPLESNVSEYPLLNEIVFIHSSLNRFYYSRKVNTTNRVTAQAIYGVNEELEPVVSQSKKSSGYRTHTSEKKRTTDKNEKLGKNFKDLDEVYRLKHDEGDLIIEGRSGHSIRFGTSWPASFKTNTQSATKEQSPNILIRTGPDETQKPKVGEFGLVKEDINKDHSSVYIVSDQIIPLEYGSKNASNHAKSIHDLPKRLDGKQIVANSDRIVINARKDKILAFALNGIHLGSAKDVTVDADKNYESDITKDEIIKIGKNQNYDIGVDSIIKIGRTWTVTAGTSITMTSPMISLFAGSMAMTLGGGFARFGSKGSSNNPMTLGDVLANFLSQFLDAFILNAANIIAATAPPGMPSQLNPKVVAELTKLKVDAVRGAKASFNSGVAFTSK